MPKEQWKDVVGYEGLYQVSDMGRVKSLVRKNRRTEIILKCSADEDGYLRVGLKPPRHSQQFFYVHRLVLEAFVGPQPPTMRCRHLDGNPKHNLLKNLRWGTYIENEGDKRKHGTVSIGSHRPLAKLTDIDVIEIKTLATKGISQRKIAAKFNVCQHTICQVINKQTWRHVNV